MMDISPLNRPQTDATPSATDRRSDVSASTDDSNRFDKHLNERMDQVKSEQQSSNTEKSEVKQQPESVSKETKGSDLESADESVVKEISSEVGDSLPQTEPDDTVLMQILLAEGSKNTSGQTTDVSVASQQILPQEGSDLPLSADDVPTPVIAVTPGTEINAAIKITDPLTDKVSAEKNPLAQQAGDKVLAEKNPLTQQTLDLRQSPDARVAQKETPALNPGDDAPVDPELIPAKAKQVIKSEDLKSVINIDAKSSAVSSVVTTASLLQQVPGMTSVSAAHLPPTALADPALSANSALFKSTIPMPLQNPNWSHGVSERVAWMVQGNFQNAEIKLNPAHLGPMEIKMSIIDDQAKITFVSAHAPVREALDQAIPRLREMLEQQGLNLVDVDVSQYSDSQKDEAGEFESGAAQSANDDGSDIASTDIQQGVIQVNSDSGVNLYA